MVLLLIGTPYEKHRHQCCACIFFVVTNLLFYVVDSLNDEGYVL